MSQKLIIDKPVFIEDEGKRVAVILPIELYEKMWSLYFTHNASRLMGTEATKARLALIDMEVKPISEEPSSEEHQP